MATIYLTDEDDGGWLARCPLLLGAVAFEPTEQAAIEAAIRRAEEQAATYRALGLPLPEGYPPAEWQTERRADMTVPEDYAALDDGYLATALALMEHSRQRLLQTAARFSPQALDWRVPEAPEWPFNARDVLHHVADAEWAYVSRLTDWPRHPGRRLRAVRAGLLQDLGRRSEAELSRRCFNYSLHWTARRALRGVLEMGMTARLARLLEAFAGATGAALPPPPSLRPCVWLGSEPAAYLVPVGQGWAAFVDGLPGVMAQGEERGAVLEALAAATERGLAFARRLGQSVPSPDLGAVRELPAAEPATAGGWLYGIELPGDRLPMRPPDLEPYARAIEAATEEQAAYLEALPEEAWSWHEEGSPWTVEAAGQEWANLNWWLWRCLSPWPEEPLERLEAVRARAVDRYRQLSPLDRQRVTVHVGEEWTARKCLRRTLEHEREHTWHLEEILAKHAAAS